MEVLVLNSDEILKLNSHELIHTMRETLSDFSSQRSKNFERHVLGLKNGPLGLMCSESKQYFAVKLVSVFEKNSKLGLNPHQGMVALFDSQNGKLTAIADGSTITALRTAAVSAAATENLSRLNSETLGIIGTGEQALRHIQFISMIRPVKNILIKGRTKDKSQNFCTYLEKYNITALPANNIQHILNESDIITTVTNSHEALFSIEEVCPGTHLNLVGASRPGSFEVSLKPQKDLLIYVDSKTACFSEADELMIPINKGLFPDLSNIREIGEVFEDLKLGRSHEKNITVFKSVGLGIEDLGAIVHFLKLAYKKNRGKYVNL